MKDEEAGTNLMADIGYTKTTNDISGTIAGKDLTADRDLTAWTIGVRGEKEFVSGKNQIVPYVGLRYMNVDPSSYTSYYNGKKAFEYDADKQDIWMVPLGVSFRNETKTGSGWRITPKLDVAYIWAFGDTDNEVDVNMAGASAPLYYTVMDDGSWLASLGIDASQGAWTFGAGYAYQKGDDTKNNKWYVNAGFAF
ncbi:autotransporter outer membrane beta-barrel domain-containing protein [uncultured Megasphaera sp.]|uniref:autotransporter outer membrane beta-barrel domain-containing protein n=1 Tax=uncultured Megasphaera sp. TaxID=165188 RepID=UPI00260FC3BD|nr:autotransporter outer membrane beta-barrel domain-containing protein [uncultured Megasphaera sp.]